VQLSFVGINIRIVQQSKHIHVTDIEELMTRLKVNQNSIVNIVPHCLSTLSMTEEKDYVMRFPFQQDS
jgi:hypothetical protein